MTSSVTGPSCASLTTGPVILQQAASRDPSRFRDRSLQPALGCRVGRTHRPQPDTASGRALRKDGDPRPPPTGPEGPGQGPRGKPSCVRVRCALVAAHSCLRSPLPVTGRWQTGSSPAHCTAHACGENPSRMLDAGVSGARSQRVRHPRPAADCGEQSHPQRATPAPPGHADGGARQEVPE